MPRPWTDQDVQRLRELWAADLIIPEIAEEMGRTRPSIEKKRKKLKLAERRRGNKATHPVHSMQPGDSVVVQISAVQRATWARAARRKNIRLHTKQISLKGEVCYRITRVAA
jgi:hypothetical protein